jgi:hypothetical protein
MEASDGVAPVNARQWPFNEPENLGVLSRRQVFEDGMPILLISRDQDGDWQFLDGSDNPRVEDGIIVCLGRVLERDSTIAESHDLPTGWIAWRTSVGAPWRREPSPWAEDRDAEGEASVSASPSPDCE